jgi:DNA mismatch repair protein MutS
VDAIEHRLDAVEELNQNLTERKQLQELLHGVYDIERLCSKIVYGTLHARDCIALQQTLERVPFVKETLKQNVSAALKRVFDQLDEMEDVFSLLARAICDEPPASLKDGGFIRAGYNAEVDDLRSIANGSESWLERFEAQEREQTKIKSLRVGYNRVFGYYMKSRSPISSSFRTTMNANRRSPTRSALSRRNSRRWSRKFSAQKTVWSRLRTSCSLKFVRCCLRVRNGSSSTAHF